MKKKRFKSYHLLIVPYDNTDSRAFFLPGGFLKFLFSITIAFVIIVTLLVVLHTRNFYRLKSYFVPTMKKNFILTKENDLLKKRADSLIAIVDSLNAVIISERAVHRERLSTLNQQVEKIKNFAQHLRIMAGFKLEPKDVQPPGLGGPLPNKNDNFLVYLNSQNENFPTVFNSAENLIHKKARETMGKLKILWDYFEKKSAIIEGTPEMKPVPGRILSGFGYRINPFTGGTEFHKGVDIPAPIGTKVRATADGVVVFAGWRGGYGNILEIDHGNHYKTIYGHLHSFKVNVGDRVKEGDFIGEVGNTGRSTGPHLHYEVRLNDIAVNPVTYFKSVKERKRELKLKTTKE